MGHIHELFVAFQFHGQDFLVLQQQLISVFPRVMLGMVAFSQFYLRRQTKCDGLGQDQYQLVGQWAHFYSHA